MRPVQGKDADYAERRADHRTVAGSKANENRRMVEGGLRMRTLDKILRDGIKDSDWTYCKAEYAPHEGCNVGLPETFTPDGTTKDNVEVCYIVTLKDRLGMIQTHADMMFLSDGKFYWYDNLWDDDEIVDQEKTDEWFVEPIAWIPYLNIPDVQTDYPNAPCNADAVPTPPKKEG